MEARLRADAERNREALVAAATAVFAEQGLQAPLDEVARRAGVGNATLYRRFPQRSHLVEAVFGERFAGFVELTNRALRADDPWQAFCDLVMHLCALQAEDRGLSDLLTTTDYDDAGQLAATRTEARVRTFQIIERARLSDGLRADFTPQDFMLLLIANAAVARRTADVMPEAWRRHLALALDGLRAPAATPAPPPPDLQELTTAVRWA